jgi:D-alanine-D-alanine ligase
MIIGLVYDLRDEYRSMGYPEEQTAEFDSIETIDAMAEALTRLGHTVDRIGHGKKLAQRLVRGDHWDLVFSIAEGLKGRCREAQVPALLELYDQPYAFSDALTMAVALDKAVAKQLVAAAGVPTAPFMLIETGREDLSGWSHYPAFVKPLAEGTGKGCELGSKVHNPAELLNAARALLHRFQQPALVEAFLPGREFTVGIVGNGAETRVVGVMEILLNADADPGVYSMRNKEDSETLCTYTRADDAQARRVAELGLMAYLALGCRDSCRLDFRSDAAGSPFFLEANPIAGLHPTHSDLPIVAGLHGISYDALMEQIIAAAAQRYGLQTSRAATAVQTKRRQVG